MMFQLFRRKTEDEYTLSGMLEFYLGSENLNKKKRRINLVFSFIASFLGSHKHFEPNSEKESLVFEVVLEDPDTKVPEGTLKVFYQKSKKIRLELFFSSENKGYSFKNVDALPRHLIPLVYHNNGRILKAAEAVLPGLADEVTFIREQSK